jgi:hypothetical protein
MIMRRPLFAAALAVVGTLACLKTESNPKPSANTRIPVTAARVSAAPSSGGETGTGGSGKVSGGSPEPGTGSGVLGGTGGGATDKQAAGGVKDETPVVVGDLDPSVVAKEVHARTGAVRACYDRSLRKNPNLNGKLKVRWTITADGSVSAVQIQEDSMRDANVAACVRSLVSRWRFPAPSKGSVDVVFPFVFQSAKQ